MNAAAEYFSSIKRRPWVKVVEAETVPKARPGTNGLFLPLPGNETEPLGRRILEMPENPSLTDHQRSPHSGFLAYVPVGSVARGEELVTKGGGKTVACGICHGADLQGMGDVPGIVDRPVSYLARQLVDVQMGTRESPMMKPVVAKLTEDDIIDIVAYLGSK
jgi:cytochrome c553